MIKKIIILLTLIFLIAPLASAKVKVKIGGGSYSSPIIKTGIKSYMLSNSRSISDLSSEDINMCSKKDYTKDNFLCEGINLSLSSQSAEINRLQKELETTVVNQYNSVSVNAYNSKIDTLDALIKKYNSELSEKCINMVEYCQPYECNKKYPGTIYQKSTNSCVCSNGQVFDRNISVKTGNGCNVAEEITRQCQNTFGVNSYSNGKKGKNGKYDCFCKEGYTWNSNNTNCIKDYSKMTQDEICQDKHGKFSYGYNNTCYCKEGYRWTSDKKNCEKIPLLEKFKGILKKI